MLFSDVIAWIITLSENNKLTFTDKAKLLESELNKCSSDDILMHLDYAGVIPECFSHDSTEEKLYAKYCDALLTQGLNKIGLQAEMIAERSDAADVRAQTSNYNLVGDAKAFRLSRTAKNQKDFKVEALNQWRGGADYACLVSPFYQYPNNKSQIYAQAIRYNVTLLSYLHITFMIRSQQVNSDNIRELWQLGDNLRTYNGESDSAPNYWASIEKVILKITRLSNSDWNRAINNSYVPLHKQAILQINYWEEEKKKISALDQKSAIRLLIQSLKIDSKIQTVKDTAGL